MEDRKSDILRKVRGLLAQAESTTHEGEAAVFRAKADQLMTTYAIEEFMVREADPSAARKPEVRWMDISWWYKMDGDIGSPLWALFASTARLARTKIVVQKTRYQDEAGNLVREVAVVGMPADLDYHDMMFTSLMLTMLKQLYPEYDSRQSQDENVYRMRMAGMGWPEIAKRLYEAGIIDPPKGHEPLRPEPQLQWNSWSAKSQQAMRSRLASRYRDYAKANGLEKTYVMPQVHQRSFAAGFSETVGLRIYDMRRAQQATPTADHGGTSYALVVASTESLIDALLRELWPELFAEVRGTVRRGGRLPALREVKMNRDSVDAGRSAGKKVNLSTNAAKLGSRKALEG